MNRKEATEHIGKQIRVVDPLQGNYIGELVDIIAEPRKPWRGKVKIIAIEQYPVQNLSDGKVSLSRPPYHNGKIYEIPGSKIEFLDQITEENYDQSLIKVLLEQISYFKNENKKVSSLVSELEKEIKEIDPSYVSDDLEEIEYQYYTISKENDTVVLVDEQQQKIPLEECPFDFQIEIDGTWSNVHYVEKLTFIDDKQKLHKLIEGQSIRLNKEQFDPYQLLINELEKPALDSLTSGLRKFKVSHENCVNCHNTLLNQYLFTQEQNNFKGVNFISYQSNKETLIVQHHYEREISDDGEDITYDRFEFTNDKGKRLLVTYTTETS